MKLRLMNLILKFFFFFIHRLEQMNRVTLTKYGDMKQITTNISKVSKEIS